MAECDGINNSVGYFRPLQHAPVFISFAKVVTSVGLLSLCKNWI